MHNMPLTLNHALDDYYEVKRGGYSSTSWRSIVGRLEDWRRWVTHETQPNVYLTDVCDPSVRYMERYFNRLRPPRYAEASFNLQRQHLNKFWAYTRERGWVHNNPMMHIDPLRVRRKVRLQLSADEQFELLEGAIPRDRIALALGMNTALRATDIMTLRIGQVNLTNDLISAWIEKSDAEKTLPITAELHVELVRWFMHYADAMRVDIRTLPNDWHVVPTMGYRAVKPMSPELGGFYVYKPDRQLPSPERVVHKALHRIGHTNTRGEGFHTLRRSAARVAWDLAREDGVGDPIVIPQSLLGHKNRATTELYLGVTQQDAMRDDMMRGKPFLSRATARAKSKGSNVA